ncbi:MAG: type II secretion system F family protein [Actinomycetota bacterium]
MSNIYLILAILGTFGAILVAGFALDVMSSERRRTMRLLESQVGQGSDGGGVRRPELSRPFVERAFMPFIKAAGSVAKRLTPIDARARIEHRLVLAGSPAGWDAERVAALKVIGAIGGLILGVAVARLRELGVVGTLGFSVLLLVIGFLAPDTILNGRVRQRQKEIRNALPDVMDLLTISVEAGLSLNTALAQVVTNVPGVLSQEIGRMLQEIQLGVSRADAFRNLAERTDVEELNNFSLAMIQADVFGVSISSVLRAQAHEGRVKRRQRAERLAMQAPVKITFPLILCIFPALLIVVIGPGAIRIAENIFR